MKIFYIPGDYPFCYYYRGYLPGVYDNQFVVSDFFKPDMDVSGFPYVQRANEADIIVFQRPTSKPSLNLARLLKLKGKKIVMDNDDTYSGIPLARLGSEKRVEIAKELNQNLVDFAKFADGITVSTQYLADEYRVVNPNVVVLKNTIDPLDEQPCKENTTGKFRIGLIGSVTSNDDYIHIKDQLKRLDDRGDCTIVIQGVKFANGSIMPSMQEDYDFWNSLKNVEWHPVCFVTEYMSNLASLALDLAIIPRKEHYFNRCKSNLKFLEMSLLKIPVISQDFEGSPYEQDRVFHTMILDNTTWYDKIIDVKDNYPHYKDLAGKAHDYVLENYNVTNYAKHWTETIINLVKNK